MSLSRREFCLNAAAASSLLTMLKSQARAQALENTGLKDLYKNDFRIGTAISNQTLQQKDAVMLGLIAKEFDAITPENCLKWGQVHPAAGPLGVGTARPLCSVRTGSQNQDFCNPSKLNKAVGQFPLPNGPTAG